MFAHKVEYDMNQWLTDRKEALLSMDKQKILEYSKKYYSDAGYNEADEHAFWVGIHKARSGSIDLPEFERCASMAWLKERGIGHFASDLEEKCTSCVTRGTASAFFNSLN